MKKTNNFRKQNDDLKVKAIYCNCGNRIIYAYKKDKTDSFKRHENVIRCLKCGKSYKVKTDSKVQIPLNS